MFSTLLAIIVSATIDSTTINIGDQTDLHLQTVSAPSEQVRIPVFGSTLIPEVEIVETSTPDTTTLPDGRIQIDQHLRLTSFHDSLYAIEPLAFVSGKDTFWSAPLTLNVIQPFDIDTNKMAIADIKPIQKAPVWWWGIIRWVLMGLIIIGLGIAAWFVVRYIRKRRGTAVTDGPKEPERPADEVALEKLDQIKQEKIWQEGKLKQYQTELTDVIREYISRRYHVSSTEKTSDETLRAMKPLLSDRTELFARLQNMLRLADLVKFAKWTTTPDENENSLSVAYDFVKQTTPAPEAETQTDTQNTENKE